MKRITFMFLDVENDEWVKEVFFGYGEVDQSTGTLVLYETEDGDGFRRIIAPGYWSEVVSEKVEDGYTFSSTINIYGNGNIVQ